MEKEEALKFIRKCVSERRILWSYHVNMRLKERFISREDIIHSFDSYEIIEEYPEDKSLPCYLVYSKNNSKIFHILFAVDLQNKLVTIITSYKPTTDKWDSELKRRLQ